jgi:hypothetical protein
MGVDAKLVKDLRSKTGAGMMDCKQALVKSSGDLDKAIDFLRKSGVAKAEKKNITGCKRWHSILLYSPGKSTRCVIGNRM